MQHCSAAVNCLWNEEEEEEGEEEEGRMAWHASGD